VKAEFLYRERESAGQALLLAPLLLLEGPYRVGAWLHRRLYAWGFGSRARLPCASIGVGNLLAGGSAKTPLVAFLAGELLRRGHKVAVLSRGVHGAREREVNVVSDGERLCATVADAGDEPVWMAQQLLGVPVLAGRNRLALALRASALFGAELLVLDDAFQHHRVRRDLDLVCVDARLGLGNRHVLPRGPLREPASALRAADALVWTRAELEEDPPAPLRELAPGAPCFRVALRPQGLRELGSRERFAPERLRGTEVGVFAGVARPGRLARDVESCGARVVRLCAFPDHHSYSRADLEALESDLPWITTAKDAVKLPDAWLAGRRVWVLEESVVEPPGQDLCGWVERSIERRRTEQQRLRP
jgi:tetraacyldisaccharide 4'-kinase